MPVLPGTCNMLKKTKKHHHFENKTISLNLIMAELIDMITKRNRISCYQLGLQCWPIRNLSCANNFSSQNLMLIPHSNMIGLIQ